MLNFAPSLKRSWLEIELIPKNKTSVTASRVEKFQKRLAEECGMHVFCGPMIIAPDIDDKLKPYYTNKEFKPRDWNAYTWWTQPDAKNIVSILDHSHTSLYYYPEHCLINISIATCKDYDLEKTIRFVYDFWKPTDDGVRYAYISPENEKFSWKTFKS